MEKEYSVIQLGHKITKPRIAVGTKIHAYCQTKDGKKMIDGHVISNNTIHFSTLEPLYDIMTNDVDSLGHNVILENVPESLFI